MARTEAIELRKHATPEELSKLNFDTLVVDNPNGCIYGQMTGDCKSLRAEELINLCCPVFYRSEEEESDAKETNRALTSRLDALSAIEVFIIAQPQNNKALIKYLRGETKSFSYTIT